MRRDGGLFKTENFLKPAIVAGFFVGEPNMEGSMPNEKKLIDLDKKDIGVRYGNIRTLQVVQCPVCHGITNHFHVYHDGMFLDALCKNSGSCWHHRLDEKIRYLHKYPHPKSIKAELLKEIEAVRTKYQKNINDLAGPVDHSKKIDKVRYFLTISSFTDSGKKCCRAHELLKKDRSFSLGDDKDCEDDAYDG